MSGLEPLASLSLACNVMQIISFGRETCTAYRQIKESGIAVPELVSKTTNLSKLSQQLDDNINRASLQSLTLEQKELQNVAQQCFSVARKLDSEFKKLSVTSQRRVLRLEKTFKVYWRKHKLEALEKEMDGLQNILQSRLLQSISSQNEAAALQHIKGFEKLDKTLRQFIAQYAFGKTELSDLLQQSTNATTEAVAREGITTRAAVSKELKQFAEATKNGSDLSQLVESLYFPGMNERRSQIKDSYPGTFRWILHPDTFKGSSSSLKPDWNRFPEWLQQETTCSSGIYWISGKAGSGKSTLMKYLVESKETKAMLEILGPHQCLVVSYFFTVSGSLLQRSIRGMLCSILRHILLAEPSQAINTVNNFADVSEKRSATEWSEREIMAVLHNVISGLRQPICIFIDGLDEVDPRDDVFVLLELIRQLSAFPNTKLCISSRPENIYAQQFRAAPQLRLQDLTKGDIIHYVANMLNPVDVLQQSSLHGSNLIRLQHLIHSIAAKSDGVFLWVYLVVRQLRKAVIDGDTIELLEKRLDVLPSDLTELFDQMWSRHGENEELYRADAATCFNLLLSSNSLAVDYPYDSVLLPSEGGVSLLEFSLGLRQDICASILDANHRPNCSYLAGVCKASQLKIETRCIGFLEVSRNEQRLPVVGVPDDYTSLLQFAKLTVNFIHRTAKEYLLHTEQGKRILQGNKTVTNNEFPVKLFMASLARSTFLVFEQPVRFSGIMQKLQELFQSASENSKNTLIKHCQALWRNHRALWFETGCEEYSNSSSIARYIYHCIYEKQNPLGNVSHGSDTTSSLEIRFPLFFESGRLDFLSWASRYGFSRFVLQTIESTEQERPLSTEYKSYLLQSASNLLSRSSSEITGHCVLICVLLDKGADPNMICPYEQSSDGVEGSRPIETFIYALKDRLLWSKDNILDHKILSKTLERMIERADINVLTFSTYPGFSDGYLGCTKRTMRQEMLLPVDYTTTLYLNTSIRMLLLDFFDELRAYCPEISSLYPTVDLSELDDSHASDVILVAEPLYYPKENTDRTISRWIGRLPTKQENDIFQASSRTSTDETHIPLSRVHPPGALELSRRTERGLSLDIIDIHNFLVEKGFHEPLCDIETWSQQFSLDKELVKSRNLTLQTTNPSSWTRGRFH